jgi:UDP-glucose 4-epimerase
VRDYIHVQDLAQAHLLALERLLEGAPGGCYNLGNGLGFSVRQVVAAVERASGLPVPLRLAPRRPGDPAALVGASARARSELGWRPRFPDLEAIVASAWNWHSRNPEGYGQ